MRNTKILQVGKFYPIRGGVEKVMYDLTLGLAARKIQCDMLCATVEGHPPGIIRINAYANVIAVKTQIKFAATMIAPSMIVKLRQMAGDYDVIHIHHPDPMACLALYCSRYKGKVVVHWHSDILKQKSLLKLYGPLQRWLINRADLIVGTTPVYVQQSTYLSEVQHKVDYIPIGVEPVPADLAGAVKIRRQYGDKNLIFSLGRLVNYKGYEHLINAARHLNSGYHIIIGGKGPLENDLKQLVLQLGVQDRVSLIGYVPDTALPAHYAACDVFCLSSVQKTEAFAIVQIEAMSCAKPVLSAHIPGSGVSWVNADGISGRVVKRKNPEALAQAIQDMTLHKEIYGRLSKGSFDRYHSLFTREKMIDKCVSLYETLIGDGKG